MKCLRPDVALWLMPGYVGDGTGMNELVELDVLEQLLVRGDKETKPSRLGAICLPIICVYCLLVG